MPPELDSILIVEDDAAFASVLARALRRRGHRVDVAATAEAAWSSAREAPPDAAVIDLKLGEDSGLELIEPLLEIAPAARLLVLTGYASLTTAVTAIKRGAFNYLAKPADADQILAALDAAAGDTEDTPDNAFSPRRLEWEHIQRVLAEHDGNVSAAARAMGMYRRTLQRKLAKRPVRR